ncbi:MAG: hypothetical protein M1812_003330 [Candelaria pacifica]|nr:MAG: hypothetical protein M1812_003330 [Candelaria pacifica]
MYNNTRRVSTKAAAISTTADDVPSESKDKERAGKDMWSSMLDSVASGKRLPEKSVIVLGGTSDSQRELLDSIFSRSPNARRPQDRNTNKLPPIANQFALGYTYHDVLDAEQEDVLARLSFYLLTDPSPSFAALLKPLLNPQTIPHVLVVILLDWARPWIFLRQLRDWVGMLRPLLASLDFDAKEVMEENMSTWRNRWRGGEMSFGGGGGFVPEHQISIPLGPGEWDEALGIPLCVVCQNADQIDLLDKEHGWGEEDFDYVLQSLRTVLLKHGGSLIYTPSAGSTALQQLLFASLGIPSLFKDNLKHNVIDRDKVVVPPSWDSWGKIRILREGFDVEGVSAGWSGELRDSEVAYRDGSSEGSDVSPVENGLEEDHDRPNGVIALYENTIRDPQRDGALAAIALSQDQNEKIEVKGLGTQEFLAQQAELLERTKIEEGGGEDKKDIPSEPSRRVDYDALTSQGDSGVKEENRVNEHIGPVQFNMGGIQVDADDMLKRLKDREANRTPEPETAPVPSSEGKTQNEALATFFAGLMKRGNNSSNNSPK